MAAPRPTRTSPPNMTTASNPDSPLPPSPSCAGGAAKAAGDCAALSNGATVLVRGSGVGDMLVLLGFGVGDLDSLGALTRLSVASRPMRSPPAVVASPTNVTVPPATALGERDPVLRSVAVSALAQPLALRRDLTGRDPRRHRRRTPTSCPPSNDAHLIGFEARELDAEDHAYGDAALRALVDRHRDRAAVAAGVERAAGTHGDPIIGGVRGHARRADADRGEGGRGDQCRRTARTGTRHHR